MRTDGRIKSRKTGDPAKELIPLQLHSEKLAIVRRLALTISY